MSKLTAKKLANGYKAARMLLQLPLPGKAAYKVKKISDALKSIAEAYDVGRDAIIKEFGVEDKKSPGVFRIPPEKRDEYDARMKEIDDVEEPVEMVNPIYIDELEKVEFPGMVFEDLDWCITERPK